MKRSTNVSESRQQTMRATTVEVQPTKDWDLSRTPGKGWVVVLLQVVE
jgi:hypothetical protein